MSKKCHEDVKDIFIIKPVLPSGRLDSLSDHRKRLIEEAETSSASQNHFINL